MKKVKYKTIYEALMREYIEPNRDEGTYDEIPPIENPFESGDAKAGFDAALQELAAYLFGKQMPGGGKGNSDPRLIQPPSKPGKSQENNNNKNNNENNNSTNQSEITPLSPEELNKLIDKVKAARNAADDVIQDEEQAEISKEQADNIEQELKDLEKDAKNAETKSDANAINARLKAIADFWNDDTVKEYKKDIQSISTYRRLRKELRKQAIQARANAARRNRNYKPLNIDGIVNNIVKTIKTQVADIRDSSWSRYNDRANDLGYVAPGRFTNEAPNKKPKVVFYFDVSGSWSGNREKIDMGHRIEEALKKLDDQKKIELSCYYFGTKVHPTFTEDDGGNSDAPIPHAIELLAAKELDNIIIMTDDNPQSNQKLNVPGYAWLLFYDTVSESLATNVSGKRGTSIVMIDHGKGA